MTQVYRDGKLIGVCRVSINGMRAGEVIGVTDEKSREAAREIWNTRRDVPAAGQPAIGRVLIWPVERITWPERPQGILVLVCPEGFDPEALPGWEPVAPT